MRICFINPPIEFYSPASGGAISTIIMQVAKELIALGHQVTVMTKKNNDECYDIGEIVEIIVPDKTHLTLWQRLKCKLFRDLEGADYPYYEIYRNSFTKALRELPEKQDAIVVFNDLVSARHIKKSSPHSKVIVWLQNELHTKNKFLKQTFDYTHCILTCSQYIREWVIRTYGLEPNKVIAATSGVDGSIFFPFQNNLETNGAIKTKAVFVGRIDPNKGPDIALHAVQYAAGKGMKVPFTIAGDVWFYNRPGDEQDQFRASLVNDLETLTDKNFLGHVSHARIAEVYRENDVAFVLSRSNEPLGLVPLEAMASGCAVIASNRGGLPEACGDAGVLLDPDDQDAVNAALLKLCTDRDWLQYQKKLSLARAREATWFKTAQIFVGALFDSN
jgi:glycosyltransferase involved in cell wall biosynthesis